MLLQLRQMSPLLMWASECNKAHVDALQNSLHSTLCLRIAGADGV